MATAEAFTALFDRMPELVRAAVQGLSEEQLAHRPGGEANPIAWLIWHLSRIEDDHIAWAAQALGHSECTEEVYVSDGWARRFDLPFDDAVDGFSMPPEDVAKVRAPAEMLVGYYDAVHAHTLAFLDNLDDDDWGRVVDTNWTPAVTLLSRIVSVANEVAQHVGQAAYIRGLLEASPS